MPTKRKIVAEFTRDELWQIIDEYKLPAEGRRSFDDLRPPVQRLPKKVLREILVGLDRKRLKQICRALGLDDSGKEKADIADRLIGGNDIDTEADTDTESDTDKEIDTDKESDLDKEVDSDEGRSSDSSAPKPKRDQTNDRKANPGRPRLFVGSTVEALSVAWEVQAELDHEFDVTIWSQSLFNPGDLTWSRLVSMARHEFDFALLVFSSDDVVESRGTSTPAPRDNVLLEYGLFVGAIGPDRTFFLYDRSHRPKIASDLAGVTALDYRGDRSDGNLRAAIGPACTSLRKRNAQLGRLH
jgi:predicted nucleotide-binding protein